MEKLPPASAVTASPASKSKIVPLPDSVFPIQYYDVSDESRGKQYAVFDFDNTCSIFDVEEQLAIYQLCTMAFEIEPEDMRSVLLTDLETPEKDLSEFGYGKGSLEDWAGDISDAYSILWEKYGPFTSEGVDESTMDELEEDSDWQEFSTKMRALYSLVYEAQSSNAAYPWITYWFTGMTEEEIYELAVLAFDKFKNVDTSVITWTSPASVSSRTGVVSCEWISGIQVSENINELMSALDENEIDVWVCSASCTAAVRAAIDSFSLHNYCTGIVAMTDKTDTDGRYIPRYDAETGCGFYANPDGTWTRMTRPTKSQTQGAGSNIPMRSPYFIFWFYNLLTILPYYQPSVCHHSGNILYSHSRFTQAVCQSPRFLAMNKKDPTSYQCGVRSLFFIQQTRFLFRRRMI